MCLYRQTKSETINQFFFDHSAAPNNTRNFLRFLVRISFQIGWDLPHKTHELLRIIRWSD